MIGWRTALKRHASTRPGGFTLVEIMVVVAIVSIIAAVAVPSYLDSVRRSDRAAARSALMTAAQWMERQYTANNTYCAPSSCSANPLPTALSQSPPSGTAVYAITAATAASNTFVLSATPVSNGRMRSDPCGTLTLDSVGTRGQSGIPGAAGIDRCWSR
jgi:type IV pilus assembly protein PilE